MSGPVPKRTAERRRRNKPEVPVVTAPSTTSTAAWTWPEPDPNWHPIARDTFVALGISGQSKFYEASDPQAARFVCHLMSEVLSSSKINGQLAAVVLQGLTELLATEGARRRARIELERGAPDVPNSVIQLAAYKRKLG